MLPRIVDRHVMEGRPLSLALIEIDGFAGLCEQFGTEVGDRVLAAAAILLRSGLRPTDHIVRHVDGCFVLVLAGTALAAAHRTAKRVRESLRVLRLRSTPADLPTITASIGLAELEPAQSAAALLARTEAALHRARQSGPNSCAA
jgi:diguanylate cyclase (GGDEF)-like protein